MKHGTNVTRFWIAVALAVPLTALVAVGALDAQGFQPRPQAPQPQIPRPQVPQPGIRPPVQQPQFQPAPVQQQHVVQVWTCSRCRRDIGQGESPPARCPHCNARLTNGVGGSSEGKVDGGVIAFILIAGVVVCAAVVGAIWLIVSLCSRGDKPARRKRRYYPVNELARGYRDD